MERKGDTAMTKTEYVAQVGRLGHHNKVTINQGNVKGDKIGNQFIEYAIDENKPRQTIPARTVKTRGIAGVVSIFASLLSGWIGLSSNLQSMLPIKPASWYGIFGIGTFALLITALANLKFVKLLLLSFLPEKEEYVGWGRFAKRQRTGDFVQYERVSPCIYPKCTGVVQIQGSPPRERPRHQLVGVCSIGGHQHTYTVDANYIGFPRQFDWREPKDDG